MGYLWDECVKSFGILIEGYRGRGRVDSWDGSAKSFAILVEATGVGVAVKVAY